MTSLNLLAYLDPGTGSMLLQAIVGGSAGMVVLFRHLWRSVRYSRGQDSAATPSITVAGQPSIGN